MNDKLYTMLKSSAEADIAKAELTLELLSDRSSGVGDHSTGDFYKNAEEALSLLSDAKDRIEALENYKLSIKAQKINESARGTR
tara:strand:+ start:448 stop:699 length:252 start_codon:yes stop_codon:yes gene_type:complete